MNARMNRLTVLAVAITAISGCQSLNTGLDSVSQTVREAGAKHGMLILCGVGAVGGAIIGAKVGGKKGALIGGGLGTAAGCYAGSIWEAKMKALEQIAHDENMSIQVQSLSLEAPAANTAGTEGGLVALVQDESMFTSGSAQLTPSGKRQAQKLAQAFAQRPGDGKEIDQRRFLVVGHTDATGSAGFNQKLSEQRARTVGKIFQDAGVKSDRIYYQGAGSSRPVANNETVEGRSSNRRVEISEMKSEDILVKRVQAESSNAKYAVYSAGTQKKAETAVKAPAKAKRADAATASTPPRISTKSSRTASAPVSESPESSARVNFGGVLASNERSVTASIKPKSGGFAFISSAHASDLPIQSCEEDAPRETGQVLSLSTDKPLIDHKTYEYMAGYNNRVWAERVNGNLLTITPVSILKENAAVDRQPILEIVKDYDAGNRKSLKAIQGIANTYEGETQVLYRVFAKDPNAAVSCIDVVFEKNAAQATKGQVFYPRGQSAYVAKFVPIKAS
ncbi:OmpA family protein [Pseudomonas viridiflava]|uniref:OmpA family protein n=1 Tax=Pseudomonas viridiflava TaxID=33069 RepID=UPI0015E2E797|nr:OmpA family protein [Pseudomonas viridiflava]MBA1229879.1 OmpA family protein [Pseudomonas viridiflava]